MKQYVINVCKLLITVSYGIIKSMVRIINEHNVDFLSNCVYGLLRFQELFTHIEEYNNPCVFPCIYVMWHKNQFLVHGIRGRVNLNIQISNSIDGEIIARAVEKWGFKVVRGSSEKKGAIESTMQMISRIKRGDCVGIMVDGPHGPLYKVKKGAVKLAQKTGAPIVPVHWFSPQKTFITLPSWDKMRTPFGSCNILNVYGEPIYIKPDASDEEIEDVREDIKNQLFRLESDAPEMYKEACKNGLWDKRN